MITQRLELEGGYPDGLWACAGCGAHLESGLDDAGTVMKHRDDCPEVAAAEHYRCPTSCDADCEQACHEVHVPKWEREHYPETCAASIAAAAVAAERERIRQLAVDVDAFYDAPCPDGYPDCVHQDTPFANLLAGGTDGEG